MNVRKLKGWRWGRMMTSVNLDCTQFTALYMATFLKLVVSDSSPPTSSVPQGPPWVPLTHSILTSFVKGTHVSGGQMQGRSAGGESANVLLSGFCTGLSLLPPVRIQSVAGGRGIGLG